MAIGILGNTQEFGLLDNTTRAATVPITKPRNGLFYISPTDFGFSQLDFGIDDNVNYYTG
jgi:hypothetical protein